MVTFTPTHVSQNQYNFCYATKKSTSFSYNESDWEPLRWSKIITE